MESNPRYINRDLSLVEFNRRVLFQASDPHVPLLERVRFLAIFSSNIDEFFMKRMGYLKRSLSRGIARVGHDKVPTAELLDRLRETVTELCQSRAEMYLNSIIPALRTNGVTLLQWSELSDEEKAQMSDYFRAKVFPVLTPLAVDPAHPFPFLSNLSVSLGIALHHPKNRDPLFARIKIPDVLPQWVKVSPTENRFVRLIEVVRNHLPELFPDMVINHVNGFRITRNVDIEQVRDDLEDLQDLVEEELRLRRIAEVVRLEYQKGSDPWILNLLREELDLKAHDVYETEGEINFGTLKEIASLNILPLRYRNWTPVSPFGFGEETTSSPVDVFRQIRDQDVLVHHPYESFTGSVERFIRLAVDDPHVLAIKITLYRTGDDSPLVPLLIKAAEKGKQVVVVVELKARFDEARNIYWSEMLENAGVHVVYGVVGLKTHAKVALVVRREQGEFKFYAHIGTGNYNSETAKTYTDFGLFTSDFKVTSELLEIFNFLTGLSLKKNYKKFLVSPINMREQFIEMVRREIENKQKDKPAQIIAKMNSLEDEMMCEVLYEASQAGVPIELLVRGFCCLRPGVPGLSENIRVTSIVGRFLEHSRLYYFRSGAKVAVDGRFYIGSADWMYRNLNARVETIAPIESKEIRKELWNMLAIMLADQIQSWELRSDGSYSRKASLLEGEALPPGIHDVLMARAKERSQKGYGSLIP